MYTIDLETEGGNYPQPIVHLQIWKKLDGTAKVVVGDVFSEENAIGLTVIQLNWEGKFSCSVEKHIFTVGGALHGYSDAADPSGCERYGSQA